MTLSPRSPTLINGDAITDPRSAPLPPTQTGPAQRAAGVQSPKILLDGITFDDVLLIPRRSGVMPSEADTSTRLTNAITLNIPLLSAPMDTVTESALAIALAQEGGLGFIHKNLSAEAQAREVEKVKRSANGIILDPLTLGPDDTIARAKELMRQHHLSGFPVTEDAPPAAARARCWASSPGATSSSSRTC